MKKAKKKVLFMIVVTIISVVSLISLQANAISPSKIEEIDYSYEGMSGEKAEQIVEAMFFENPNNIAPYGLLCLFGHSTQTGTIVSTEHNYYSAAPRCRETTSYVDYCTRNDCDYFTVKSQSFGRVSCH